jgi:hypothetical protein
VGFLFGETVENPFAEYRCSGDFKCNERARVAIEVFQGLDDADVRFPESQTCAHTVYCCVAHVSGAVSFLGLRQNSTIRSPGFPT